MTGGAPAGARRIQLVLIHHGVRERVEAVSPTVHVVAEALSFFGDVASRELHRQPDAFPFTFTALAHRHVRQWRLERRWARYLGVSPRWTLSSGLLALRLAQLALPSVRRSRSRQSFIEVALSSKHSLAWRNAYEDDVDVLVVLEDDARADSSSGDRIRRLVSVAIEEGNLDGSFIDLAGGLSWDELRLSAVMQQRDDGIVSLRRAATNTTCGYIIGRRVIGRLAQLTLREPDSLHHPADWLLNRLFVENAEDASPPVTCLHSTPHALAHGSFTGAVPSSIRA